VSDLSTHLYFDAQQWSKLREDAPLTISEDDLSELRGFNDKISLDEVEEIYLPLSRLLSLYVEASQKLYKAGDTFLGKMPAKVPFIIGIAGSVAVGKSTSARVLQSLLSRWSNHPRVDLITTDGFLYPNAVLEDRGIMDKKGFPQSYNRRELLQFLYDVKSGVSKVSAPIYSHLTYDVIKNEETVVAQPDILIVEGLTVLQTSRDVSDPDLFVSDFFDFSIFLDADLSDLKTWYIERFLALQKTAFKKPESYFYQYRSLSEQDAIKRATKIWTTTNERNFVENILPTRNRADLIMTKVGNHRVDNVKLRKL